jgi:hypothetical protein
MAKRFQLRRDTAANWASANPTLASGEIGIETDSSKRVKIGDGSTAWNSLASYNAATSTLAAHATALATPRLIYGASFDGSADVTAPIADSFLQTIATAGKVSNSATTATANNTVSAIVARDASGDFTARNITATLFNGPAASANAVAVANVTGLLSGGKILSSLLPAIAITDTFVVASQVAMLALTAETGDVAVRSDLNKSFILKGSDPTVLANWQELLTPTDAVLSVAGRTGAVTLISSDITDATSANTASRIVIRDASGNFAGNAITGATVTAVSLNTTLSDSAQVLIRNAAARNIAYLTNASNLGVSGSTTSDGAWAAFGKIYFCTNNAALPALTLGTDLSGTFGGKVTSISSTGAESAVAGAAGAGDTYLRLLNGSGFSGHYNWQIAKSNVTSSAFEIARSTAAGATTFAAPAFKILSDDTIGMAAGLALSGATPPTHGIQFGTSAPGALADGQVWYDGTNFKARTGGATKTFTIT